METTSTGTCEVVEVQLWQSYSLWKLCIRIGADEKTVRRRLSGLIIAGVNGDLKPWWWSRPPEVRKKLADNGGSMDAVLQICCGTPDTRGRHRMEARSLDDVFVLAHCLAGKPPVVRHGYAAALRHTNCQAVNGN